MPKLYVLDGPDRGRFFDLEGDTIYIGRSPKNNIQLKDPYVSRRHLRILRKGERYFVEDLKSKNGTSVAGEALRPGIEFELKEQTPIVIGVTVICLGQKCLDEITSLLDSINVPRVSKRVKGSDTVILEVEQDGGNNGDRRLDE
jgi:pSer/pThr/pTyr-binding forkhead associated (FHA) protein